MAQTKAYIGFPPPSLALDQQYVQYITDLVNSVYIQDEGGLWIEGFARTNTAEIAGFLETGQLAIAWTASRAIELEPGMPPPPPTSPSTILGCVRVQRLSQCMAEFGMLVCDPGHRGMGVGRDLLEFAEEWARAQGAGVMQLELLVPEEWTHPFKARLKAWYERIGYRQVRTGHVNDLFPQLTPFLAGPSGFEVYEKDLGAP